MDTQDKDAGIWDKTTVDDVFGIIFGDDSTKQNVSNFTFHELVYHGHNYSFSLPVPVSRDKPTERENMIFPVGFRTASK
jgi:hypothetical protein